MESAQSVLEKVGRATFLIVIFSIFSKALALLKEAIVAARFGVSPELDAFNIAYAYPAIIILFLSGAMIPAFVPMYIEWEKRSNDLATLNTTVILSIVSIFFCIVTFLSYTLAKIIYSFFGFGFNKFQTELCLAIANILVLMILFEGIAIIPQALIQSKKKFFQLNISLNFQNLGIIVLLLAFQNQIGIYAMAYGVILGSFAKLAYSLLVLRSFPFRFTFSKSELNYNEIKGFFLVLLPLLGSEMIANLNIFVDQIMATKLGEGAVSTLRYAYRVNDIPIQIIIMSLSQAILPYISEQALEPDRTNMKETFKTAVIFVGFLSLPITFLTLLYSLDVVKLLFERGAFDNTASNNTAQVLVCYSFGLVFYAYSFINGNFLVALRQGRFLLWVGLFSIVANFLFNLLFMHFLGVKGIALSTSVTLCIVSLIFLTILKHKLKFSVMAEIIKNLGTLLICCLIMFLVGLALKQINTTIQVPYMPFIMISVTITLLTYAGAVYILRTKELNVCLNILKKLVRNKTGD